MKFRHAKILKGARFARIGNKHFVGVMGVFLLGAVILSGCQNLGDRIAEKAIEAASGGKVNIDSNGGKVAIKTDDGDVNLNTNNTDGTVTIKTKDGTASYGGGKNRPAEVAPDMPSLDGASDFSWAGSAEGGMLGFQVASTDYKDVCTQEIALLQKNGWTLSDKFSMEVENSTTKTLEVGQSTMTLSCSADSDGRKVEVVMVKAKKTS